MVGRLLKRLRDYVVLKGRSAVYVSGYVIKETPPAKYPDKGPVRKIFERTMRGKKEDRPRGENGVGQQEEEKRETRRRR